ncbi:MAG: hypothetical protein HFJ12_03760 [Bacilli bacterium]|nr:hypothetical protein [Bacilli bacterium]
MDYDFDKLDQHFIGLTGKYLKYYGKRYSCVVPNYQRLYKIFVEEYNKYEILYNMKEIKRNEQVTLF